MYAFSFGLIVSMPLGPLQSLLPIAGFFLGGGACLATLRKSSYAPRRFVRWLVDATSRRRGLIIVALGIVCSLITYGVFVLGVSGRSVPGAVVTLVGMAAVGAIMAFMRALWHLYNVRISEGKSHAGIPMAAALVIMLALTWMDAVARNAVMLACPVATAVLLAIGLYVAFGDDAPAGMPKDSYDDAGYLTPSMHILLLFYHMTFSFALGVLAMSWTRVSLTFAMVVPLAVVLAYALSKTPWHTSMGDSAKVYLPLCALLCFAVVAPPSVLSQAALVAAFAAAVFQTCSNVTFLENASIKLGGSVVSLIATGRFGPMLGSGIGFMAAFGFDVIPAGSPAALACAAVLAAVVPFVYAMLPFNHGNAMVGGVVRDMDEGIVPILTQPAEDPERAFEEQVARIAEEHALSPREAEVFRLLARGFNTTSISEQLFISTSTAKTHCFRIYQKLGIHSKQEIIAMLNAPQDK